MPKANTKTEDIKKPWKPVKINKPLVLTQKKPVNHHTMSSDAQNGVFAIDDRRKRVTQYYLAGYSQADIAREEKVTQQLVSNDIVAIQRNWKERYSKDIHELKLDELARIDKLETMAHEAYQRSMRAEIIEIERTSSKGSEDGWASKEVHKRRRDGEDKFLARIAWCIDQRCKILGITKDQKVTNNNLIAIPWDQIVGSTGGDAINNEIAKLQELPDHVSIDGETSDLDTRNVEGS